MLQMGRDDDLELVRTSIEALSARDVDRVLETLDPDVELVTAKGLFEGAEPYRGHDGFRQYISDMSEDWEYFDYELEELTSAGDGIVVVAGRFRARGLDTGNEVSSPGAWLCQVRDGSIGSVHFYADAEAAMAAAHELAAH
jgi:ketosteroid isomerase-like protein